MIFLGLDNATKDRRIEEYCVRHSIRKVYLFSPARFRAACSFGNHEHIEWADIIRYVYYYRLLQELSHDSLIVINECLRTQNRHDLSYNCLRQYLTQTKHVLVFQYLPIIDTDEDFMILFDFATGSKWKQIKLAAAPLDECDISGFCRAPQFQPIPVEADQKIHTQYDAERDKLFRGLGTKDPHTLPRTLYQIGGKAKLSAIESGRSYIARNNRLKLPNMASYKDEPYEQENYTVFEFPHNFIEFSGFLTLTRQTAVPVLVADLKADQWYFARYQEWARRVCHAAAAVL